MTLLDRVDALAKRIENFLSGAAVNDPLYISNRTTGQKIRLGLLVGTPALALGVVLFIALDSDGRLPVDQPAPAAAAPEPAPTRLRTLDKPLATDYSRDVEILEAGISGGNDHTLSGKIRNKTDRAVRIVDVIFDVSNEDGSDLGGVAVRVENIAPKATARFKVKLEQRSARSVMVRELHSR